MLRGKCATARIDAAMQKLCAVSRLQVHGPRYGEFNREPAMRCDKSKILLAITIAVLAAMAGCAAAPATIVPAGNDGYQLKISGARFESQADTNIKALSMASEYCAKMGRNLLFRRSNESSDHSWGPKQEDLTFVCSDANDAELVRASVQREP
jgi:hypothetical protein